MKRIVSAFFALVIAFSLCACGADDSTLKVVSPDETTDKFALLQKNEAEEATATPGTKKEEPEETEADAEGTDGDEEAYPAGTVFVTDSGKKYHSGGCHHLSKSKIAISRSDAEGQGYEPCEVCNP